MKKIVLLALAVSFVTESFLFSQEEDATIILEELEDSSTVIINDDKILEEMEDPSTVITNDDEKGVNVKMDEIIKIEEKRDTTRIKIGDKNLTVIENQDGTSVRINEDEGKEKKKKFRGHWTGFELGLNNFADKDFSISRTAENQFMDLNTGHSWNVNLNIKQVSIGLISNHFGIVSGVGLEFNNYQFDGDNSIEEINGVIDGEDLSYLSLNKSKLTTTYLNIPLLLELQIGDVKRRKRLYISSGVIGGIKLGSHTKIVHREDGKKQKEKDRDDFNINPLRWGLSTRLGYRNINIYCNYYLTSFFEKNKGPDLYPFSLGLTFGF